MDAFDVDGLPADMAAELESRFFWWEPVGLQPQSHARILAQAMNLASFDDVRRLEKTLGPYRLAEAMLGAFAKMYGKDPGLPLRAMGFFKDGDLSSLPKSDQDILQKARDRVSEIPEVVVTHGSLATTAPVSHQKRSQ
jgi:hypothetical protein